MLHPGVAIATAVPVSATDRTGAKISVVSTTVVQGTPPMDSVQQFLALPAVRNDVINQQDTFRITLLKVLAWQTLMHASPQDRKDQVLQWLPHMEHHGSVGTKLMPMICTMNSAQHPSTYPPFSSRHHYRQPQLTLSALLALTERWQCTGKPVDDLLRAGQELADGHATEESSEDEGPSRRWWRWFC